MHANEAKHITKLHKKTQDFDTKLLEVIMDRISKAAHDGLSSTSMNSLTDCGNGVRGIGMYLSDNVVIALTKHLNENGYSVTRTHRVGEVYNQQHDQITINW